MSSKGQELSVAKPLAVGIIALLVLVGAIGSWSVFTSIVGAVVAKGELRVDGQTTVISSSVGGYVLKTLVENGDPVRAGDTLLVLEDKALQAKLNGVSDRLLEVLSAEALWQAQATNNEYLVISSELASLQKEFVGVDQRLHRFQGQLDLNRRVLELDQSQNMHVIEQMRQQINGANERLASLEEETALVASELKTARQLLSRGLGKKADVVRLERDLAVKRGETGISRASISEKQARVDELDLVSRMLEDTSKKQAFEGISTSVEAKARLLVERAELLTSLRNLSVLAPVNGVIHDARLLGEGTMVEAGRPVLSIVPNTDAAFARVKIRSRDIDQVYVGQPASLRLDSYNVRSTPLIKGTVVRVGADTTFDNAENDRVYDVQVDLSGNEITKIDDLELVNGMPVSAFLETEKQSPIEYLTRPITAFFSKSFRDR